MYIAARTIEWSYAFLFLLAPIAAVFSCLILFDKKAREEFRDLIGKRKQPVTPNMFSWHSEGKPYVAKLFHPYQKKKAESVYITTYLPESTVADLLCGALFWTKNCKGEKAMNEPVCLSLKACQWILIRYFGCKRSQRKEWEESKDRVEIDLCYEQEQRQENQGQYVIEASSMINDADFQELVSSYDKSDTPLDSQDAFLAEKYAKKKAQEPKTVQKEEEQHEGML